MLSMSSPEGRFVCLVCLLLKEGLCAYRLGDSQGDQVVFQVCHILLWLCVFRRNGLVLIWTWFKLLSYSLQLSLLEIVNFCVSVSMACKYNFMHV